MPWLKNMHWRPQPPKYLEHKYAADKELSGAEMLQPTTVPNYTNTVSNDAVRDASTTTPLEMKSQSNKNYAS